MYFYLGQAYEKGLIEGEKPDAAFAKELYQMAAADGFGPALAAAGIEAAAAGDEFIHPDWIRALMDGDLGTLRKSPGIGNVAVYLYGMQQFVKEESQSDPVCHKQIDHSLYQGTEGEQFEGFFKFLEKLSTDANALRDTVEAEIFSQHGTDDMAVLIDEYGGCSSGEFKKVYATMVRFEHEKPPRKPVPGGHLTGSVIGVTRIPGPADIAETDPAGRVGLEKELQQLVTRGFKAMACTYGGGVHSFWRHAVPEMSIALRDALTILPAALPACPPSGDTFGYMRKAIEGSLPDSISTHKRRPLDLTADRRGIPPASMIS